MIIREIEFIISIGSMPEWKSSENRIPWRVDYRRNLTDAPTSIKGKSRTLRKALKGISDILYCTLYGEKRKGLV